MRRRDFITLIGGAAVLAPLSARGQLAGRLPTIGLLSGQTPAAMRDQVAALIQRLQELGWIDGRTVTIEYRWAEGRNDLAQTAANEFVRLKVDVIIAGGTTNVVVAKRATSSIPIVFVAGDPVATGLVSSLARPGGNLTGVSNQSTDVTAKRLELLREVIPRLGRLAILANMGSPASVLEMEEARAAASKLAIEVMALEILRVEDIGAAIDKAKGRADALMITGDPLINSNRLRINTLALGARLPTVSQFREIAEAAGLMSYGPNLVDLFRRCGDYVDKILRGAKPADLPVEQPTKFDLVINLITAKALDLAMPPTLLTRATEVIE